MADEAAGGGWPNQASRFYTPRDVVAEPLHVIVPLINSLRWKSRFKHTERVLKDFHDSGAVVHLVEVAFGHREWAFEGSGLDGAPSACPVVARGRGTHAFGRQDKELCHQHIKLRTWDEAWLKENAINVALSWLPASAYYIAWIDADVHFLRTNWCGATVHALQHYAWLQMFSHAVDLGPNSEVVSSSRHQKSFMAAYLSGAPLPPQGYYYGPVSAKQLSVWSGLAWAAVRPALNQAGGLIDWAIHGGGDWHIAWALVGKAKTGLRTDLHPNYMRKVMDWEQAVHGQTGFLRRNVGMLEGTVAHRFHGKKSERGYAERHKMLADLQFDPEHDLKRDVQGVYQLHDDGSERFVQLREVLRQAARARNEDTVEVE